MDTAAVLAVIAPVSIGASTPRLGPGRSDSRNLIQDAAGRGCERLLNAWRVEVLPERCCALRVGKCGQPAQVTGCCGWRIAANSSGRGRRVAVRLDDVPVPAVHEYVVALHLLLSLVGIEVQRMVLVGDLDRAVGPLGRR